MKSLGQIIVLLLFSMVSLCSAQPLIPQIKVWGGIHITDSSGQGHPDPENNR